MLADACEQGKLEVEQVMAILYLLSPAETDMEIRVFLRMFSTSFPILGLIADREGIEERTSGENDMAQALVKVLRKNPSLATKAAKISAKKGMTLAGLIERFPEMKTYLE